MLREDLQNALKEAMKAKDMATVSAVRLISRFDHTVLTCCLITRTAKQ